MIEPSIFTFILFMVTGLAYILCSTFALITPIKRMTTLQRIPNSYAYAISILASIVVAAFLPLFTMIMTGNSHALLYAAMFCTTVIAIGIGDALSRALGQYKTSWYSRAIWSEIELQLMHPGLHKITSSLTQGSIFLYPLVIGYGYFGDTHIASEWASRFISTTILMLLIIPWIADFPKVMLFLSNENVMTYTRSRALINHILSAIPLFLIVSYLFWDMEIQGQSIELFNNTIVISTSLIAVFFLYVIICCVFPYLVGQNHAHQWRTKLQAIRQSITQETEEIFNNDDSEQTLSQLPALIERCNRELSDILETQSMQLAQFLRDSEDENHKSHKIAIKDASPRDPRFRHAGFIEQVRDCLEKYHETVQNSTNTDDVAASKEQAIKTVQEALPPTIDNASPWAALLLGTTIGILLSMAASTVGHSIATQLT